MGYTHYWTQKADIPADVWAEIKDAAHRITLHASKSRITLVDGMGDDPNTKPEITDELIAFNGLGDDSHESFWVEAKQADNSAWGGEAGWVFCKTAQKPYDIVVTALLCYLESVHPDYFVVTSDGDLSDWQPGLAFAVAALPEKANILNVPQSVRDEYQQAVGA